MAISLSRCSSPSIRSCLPGSPEPPLRSRRSASTRMSLTSELLPEPDTPVMQTSAQRNFNVDVLQVVVPRTDDLAATRSPMRRGCRGMSISVCQKETAPVWLRGWSRHLPSGPEATTSPPRTPGPGPKSTMCRRPASCLRRAPRRPPCCPSRADGSASRAADRCRADAARSKARQECRARRPGRSQSGWPAESAAIRRPKGSGPCGRASGS